jgi:dihydroflavonol-4-reductase
VCILKALIVGASGHLGAHLARALLDRRFEVRAFVRPSSHRAGLEGLDIEIVTGDVLDQESLRRAMKSCTYVFHLAAPTGLDPDAGRMIFEGTKAVLEMAAIANIECVVVTSSTVTVGYSDEPLELDENTTTHSQVTEYHSGKWQAERYALEYAHRGRLRVVVVNPAAIVGSLDYRITPSTAPIQRCLDAGLPISFKGGVTLVHAADVARGHILAAEGGVSGERYILGGERLTFPDYFALIAKICERQEPRLVMPRSAMLAVGACCSFAMSFGIKSVPFSFRQISNIAGRFAWYSSEKARSRLGYQWRPASEAISDYVDWVRSGRRGAAAQVLPVATRQENTPIVGPNCQDIHEDGHAT